MPTRYVYNCSEDGTLPPSEGDCEDCDMALSIYRSPLPPPVPRWDALPNFDKSAFASALAMHIENNPFESTFEEEQ
jgi:hypothetical protein